MSRPPPHRICFAATAAWAVSIAAAAVLATAWLSGGASAGPRADAVAAEAPSYHLFLPVVLADKTLPHAVAGPALPGRVASAAQVGTMSYLAADGRIFVVDVAEAARPQLRLQLAAADGLYQLVTDGRRLFALAPGRLDVYDLADLASPALVGGVAVARSPSVYGGVQYIRLYGQYVLVGDPCVAMQVLDARDSAHIHKVGSAPTQAYGYIKGVVKHFAVIEYGSCTRGDRTGVAVVNLQDPSQPRVVGEVGAWWRGASWFVSSPALPASALFHERDDHVWEVILFQVADDGMFAEVGRQPLGPHLLGAVSDERGFLYTTYESDGAMRLTVASLGDAARPVWTAVGTLAVPWLYAESVAAGRLVTLDLDRTSLFALDVADPARPVLGAGPAVPP